MIYSENLDEFQFGYATADTRGTITLNELIPIRAAGLYGTNATITNAVFTSVTASDIAAGNITVGNINLSGNIYNNGIPITLNSNDSWSLNESIIYYASGNVAIGTSIGSSKLNVAGDINAFSLLATNVTITNITNEIEEIMYTQN